MILFEKIPHPGGTYSSVDHKDRPLGAYRVLLDGERIGRAVCLEHASHRKVGRVIYRTTHWKAWHYDTRSDTSPDIDRYTYADTRQLAAERLVDLLGSSSTLGQGPDKG